MIICLSTSARAPRPAAPPLLIYIRFAALGATLLSLFHGVAAIDAGSAVMRRAGEGGGGAEAVRCEAGGKVCAGRGGGSVQEGPAAAEQAGRCRRRWRRQRSRVRGGEAYASAATISLTLRAPRYARHCCRYYATLRHALLQMPLMMPAESADAAAHTMAQHDVYARCRALSEDDISHVVVLICARRAHAQHARADICLRAITLC